MNGKDVNLIYEAYANVKVLRETYYDDDDPLLWSIIKLMSQHGNYDWSSEKAHQEVVNRWIGTMTSLDKVNRYDSSEKLDSLRDDIDMIKRRLERGTVKFDGDLDYIYDTIAERLPADQDNDMSTSGEEEEGDLNLGERVSPTDVREIYGAVYLPDGASYDFDGAVTRQQVEELFALSPLDIESIGEYEIGDEAVLYLSFKNGDDLALDGVDKLREFLRKNGTYRS